MLDGAHIAPVMHSQDVSHAARLRALIPLQAAELRGAQDPTCCMQQEGTSATDAMTDAVLQAICTEAQLGKCCIAMFHASYCAQCSFMLRFCMLI